MIDLVLFIFFSFYFSFLFFCFILFLVFILLFLILDLDKEYDITLSFSSLVVSITKDLVRALKWVLKVEGLILSKHKYLNFVIMW